MSFVVGEMAERRDWEEESKKTEERTRDWKKNRKERERLDRKISTPEILTPDILIPLRSSSCVVWFLSGGLNV